MRGIILVIALISGVYAFGRYSSANEKSEEDNVIKREDIDIIVKICLAFVASIIIASIFIILFRLLGFQQDQIAIVVATITTVTMMCCTYVIIQEIRKIKHNDE